MSSDDVAISFDDDCRVRVLDAERFKHTEELGTECKSFVKKLSDFHRVVTGITEAMDSSAKKIEDAKLKAIGLRNKVESEVEQRRRKQADLQRLLVERMHELDRITKEHDALVRMEAEQRARLEKLTNNEA
eukprot:PLAT11676.1.p2 GENE.PLAT11676.1~~PLAT11676.1.p2  ORF type:complete len:131 (+),score=80.25 PLAT11676.1:106-498(+)